MAAHQTGRVIVKLGLRSGSPMLIMTSSWADKVKLRASANHMTALWKLPEAPQDVPRYLDESVDLYATQGRENEHLLI